MTTTPKVSVLIYTARGDYPFVNPDWHCFDPVVKTLAAQTMMDFELVLVDMHWESRSDYFKKNPQPFPVKHVPSSPNFWQMRERTGLCAQINRGFAWADGELIWTGGENNLFPPTHIERAWGIHRGGTIPVAWYAICGQETGEPHRDCPAEFDLLGYTHRHVQDMDHRAKRFVEDPTLRISPCHHQNYFGYSSVPTDTAVELNGYDELFDGQWGLFDCDFGSRLNLAGKQMTLAHDLFVVEPPVAPGPYVGIGHQEAFKCHYAIYLHNRATRRKVNAPLAPGYVDDVKKIACYGECSIKDRCRAGALDGDLKDRDRVGESLYYPFCEGKNKQMAEDWFSNPPVRDLRAERETRKAGGYPYDRGCFTTP